MKKGFEKLLNVFLKKKYPTIVEVKVHTDEGFSITYYEVFIGIKYDDLLGLDENEVKNDIHDLSKNIFNTDERLGPIKFFEP